MAFPSYKSPSSTQGLRVQIQELQQENAKLTEEIIRVRTESPTGKLVEENARLKSRMAAMDAANAKFMAGLAELPSPAQLMAEAAELDKRIRDEQAEWDRSQAEMKAEWARLGIPWEIRQ